MKLKKSRRTVTVGIVAIIIAVLIVAGTFIFLFKWNPNSSIIQQVSITDVQVVYSGILYVAEHEGYFLKNGINVTFQNYISSVAGFNDLSKDKVDFVQTSEYPIVGEVFNNSDIRIVVTIGKADLMQLIGRKDHGIENISDLLGKRIAVGQGTIREFYLGRFLNLHGISLNEVTLVYLPLEESVNAIANGTIDAVVMPDDLWYTRVIEEIGSNAVSFLVQEGQPVFTNLVCRSDYLADHSQTVTKLLTALYEAENYIRDHPAEAEAIVQNRLNRTSSELGWSNYRFSLSLDLPLVTAMRDEAQWMINNNLTDQTQVPDFYNYIYTDSLRLVKPYSVTINVGG